MIFFVIILSGSYIASINKQKNLSKYIEEIGYNYNDKKIDEIILELAKYTIAFNANGGTGTIESIEGKSYTDEIELPQNSFSREGYVFTGWNTASDGSEIEYAENVIVNIKDLTSKENKTVTLYAQWTELPTEYTIIFSANGGTGTIENIEEKEYTDKIVLPQNSFTREGYAFIGWNTSFEGLETNYVENETVSISDLTSRENKIVTMYAQWKVKEYIVSFEPDGGTDRADQTVIFGNKYGNALYTPTKTGHDFVGWYTATSGGTEITSESIVSITNNHTLYAKWQIKTYTVDYLGSNIAKKSAPISATHGVTFNATITAIDGYYISAYSVKVGSTTLTSGTHYTYNTITGALSINAASITGNVTITIMTTTLPPEKELMNSSDSPEESSANSYPSTGYTWIWDKSKGNIHDSSGSYWAGDGKLGCTYYFKSAYNGTQSYIYGYTKIGKGLFLKNYTKINATAYCKAFKSSSSEYILWGIGTSGTATPTLVNSGKLASLSETGAPMTKTSLTIPTSSIVDTQDYYFVFVVSKNTANGYTHFLPRIVELSK